MSTYQPPDDQDIENPYAPPQSSATPQAVPELVGDMPFTVNDVFNWSWAIFKEHLRPCVQIFWGTFAINMAVSYGMTKLQEALEVLRDPTVFRLLFILVQFSGIVISVWLGIGQGRAYLKIARGEPVEFAEIFQGGRFVLTTILASILFIVVLAAPILVAVGVITFGILAMANQQIAGLFLFLLVSTLAGLFFIYISSRLALYYYLIIDGNAGVFDSLQQSWQLCRGNVGTIVLVCCLQAAIVLAGVVAFCVGLIIAVPLASLLLPVTYLALTGTRSTSSDKPELVWDEGQ